MKREGRKITKRILAFLMVLFLICINSFAAVVSDNDGSAFITKAEFDAIKADFQGQIDSYNRSIDAKIDGAVAAYLAGIRMDDKHLTIDWVLDWENKNVGPYLTGKRIILATFNPSTRLHPGYFNYGGASGSTAATTKIYKPTSIYGTNIDLGVVNGEGILGTAFSSTVNQWNIPVDKYCIPIITYMGSAYIRYIIYLKTTSTTRYWATEYGYNGSSDYNRLTNMLGVGQWPDGVSYIRPYTILHPGWEGALGQTDWPLKYPVSTSATGNPIDDVANLVWFPVLQVTDGEGEITFSYHVDDTSDWSNTGMLFVKHTSVGNYGLKHSGSKINFFVRKPDGESRLLSNTEQIVLETYEDDKWTKVNTSLTNGDVIGLVVQLNNANNIIPHYCAVGMNYTNLNP